MSCFNDEELSKVKATCFRGVAKVQFDALNFYHPLVQRKHRTVLQKNVRRLRRIYDKVGCLRLQEENFINAVVDDASLDDALALSEVSRDKLLRLHEGHELPLIDLHVDCLSGLHRVEAAKAFLDDNDQWWIVRLFTKDTPEPVLSRIIELYSNEQRPADGEVFRKIRLYHQENDTISENQWWAYLENSKLRNLRQLLKNRLLTSAFDSLIDMPGLWAKIQLGALNRLLALKCDEEMICYLNHVKKTWDTILTCGHTTLPYSVVDPATVMNMETLCPRYSASDKDYVSSMMQQRIIFPLVIDEGLRTILLENISSFPSLIPSLWTFFETLKYLEPICDILKRLIGDKMKGTIRRSLLGSFFQPEKIRVQKSESCDMELRGQLDKISEVAYIQLWAFCGRHFDGLTTFTPRKENGKGKPTVKGPNPVLWQRLARFALDLGFRIPAAEQLAAQDSPSRLAIDYLRKANPLCSNFSAAQIQAVVLASSHAAVSVEDAPDFSPTQLDAERRCGRPFEPDLEDDKRFLFAPIIYRDHDFTVINLQFIRRDLFRSIFGSLRFQDGDFGPPYIPVQVSSSSEIRKRADSSNDTEDYAQKRRRVNESDQILKLTAKVASLARENKTLRDRLKQRHHILESQGKILRHDAPVPQSVDIHAPNTDPIQDESHADARGSSQALVVLPNDPARVPQTNNEAVVHQSTSLSLDALFNLGPRENLIVELLASHQHKYSSRLGSSGYHEIFLIRHIAISADAHIEGLSFLADPSEAGVGQMEALMNHIHAWWEKAMRGPGPLVISEKGKIVTNHTPTTLRAACAQQGTCFVGSRNDVNNILQVIKNNRFDL